MFNKYSVSKINSRVQGFGKHSVKDLPEPFPGHLCPWSLACFPFWRITLEGYCSIESTRGNLARQLGGLLGWGDRDLEWKEGGEGWRL